MKIKKCTIDNIEAIYSLICELEETKFDYSDFKKILEYKISDNRNYLIISEENGIALGFLSLNTDYKLHHKKKVATVDELIVTSKFQGRGVGTELINNAIEYSKKCDCEVIELTSNIKINKAHEFYIKNGFCKSSYKFVLNL